MVDVLCTVSGVCISLAKMAYDNKDTIKDVITGASTANTMKIEYGLLQRETVYVTSLLESFENILKYLEVVEEETGIHMCSIDTAKKFAKETHDLLEWYGDQLVNKALKLSGPTWYREQLHFYTGYIRSFIIILSDISKRIIAERARINKIQDKEERQIQYQRLKDEFRCKY